MSNSENRRRHDLDSREPDGDTPQSRADDERLESALTGFRRVAREASDRPEHFWERQRLAVKERLNAERPGRGYNRMAWVSAAVLVLLAIVLFTPRGEPIVSDIPAGQDQELLIGIERSLDREIPQALEPGLLLTQEIQKASDQSAPK